MKFDKEILIDKIYINIIIIRKLKTVCYYYYYITNSKITKQID